MKAECNGPRRKTDENGNTIEANWQGPLDGLPVKATGTDEEVNYAFQQTDEGVREVATFPDGSRITSTATISGDGRTLTLHRHMTSPTRGQADWTEVYDKITR